jgi:hypothetical protein
MSEVIDLSIFEPRVGETFTAHLGDGDYPLTLSEATALTPNGFPGMNRDPFQLKFTGPGPRRLKQHVYVLGNGVLGEMEIFLVPIGQHGGDFLYQAVFT